MRETTLPICLPRYWQPNKYKTATDGPWQLTATDEELPMYILEIILINQKENLFFSDQENFKQEQNQFFKEVADKHQHDFFKNRITLSNRTVTQLHDGSWISSLRLGYFKSITGVKQYFAEIAGNSQPNNNIYRDARKEFHQKHQIVNETNILDLSGKLLKTIQSCHGNLCHRFATCPTIEAGGCSVVETLGDPKVFHIPLISIKRMVG